MTVAHLFIFAQGLLSLHRHEIQNYNFPAMHDVLSNIC